MSEDLKKMTGLGSYLDAIIESMVDALIVVEPDAKIRRVNQATCRLLGCEEEAIVVEED